MDVDMDNKMNNGLAGMIMDLPKPLSIPSEIPSKKTSKELRKLDERSIEQVLKSLNNLPTVEDRLAAMCKRYADIVEENRKLFGNGKTWEKKSIVTQREKEQLQLEYNKTVLLKVKLENLCRELQKQNKAVKDESLNKIKEEEERRKETQAKFQNTLSEITALMQQNNEKNSKLRDDNIDMVKKFKSVVEQYELREQQVDKMAKQMALEAQLADAKLNKANLEAQAEREKMLTEKQTLLLEMQQYQTRCVEMTQTEKALRCQIAMYTDKYDEFQNAITKSNDVFVGFKAEMEKMSKQILKLEKETVLWKQRWEKSHAAVLDLAAEKQQRDATLALHKRQLVQLQRLCRTLQAERTACMNLLKENNFPMSKLTALTPDSEINIESNDVVDAMAANCAQLKQSLAQLQGQLNVLTNKKENSSETQAAPAAVEEAGSPSKETPSAPAVQKGKNKKSKGKKGKHNDKTSKSQSDPISDAPTKLTESTEPIVNSVNETAENIIDKDSVVESNIPNEVAADCKTPSPKATASSAVGEILQVLTKEETISIATEQPTHNEKNEPSTTIQEPTCDATQEPTCDTTQEPTCDTTQEPTCDTTQEPTCDTTQEPTCDTTQEPMSNNEVESKSSCTEEIPCDAPKEVVPPTDTNKTL